MEGTGSSCVHPAAATHQAGPLQAPLRHGYSEEGVDGTVAHHSMEPLFAGGGAVILPGGSIAGLPPSPPQLSVRDPLL